MDNSDDYEKNSQKLETMESAIKFLIEEYNKLSDSVHSMKLGLVSGYNGDLAKNLSVHSPGTYFNFDPYDNYGGDDGWYSSGCSF